MRRGSVLVPSKRQRKLAAFVIYKTLAAGRVREPGFRHRFVRRTTLPPSLQLPRLPSRLMRLTMPSSTMKPSSRVPRTLLGSMSSLAKCSQSFAVCMNCSPLR